MRPPLRGIFFHDSQVDHQISWDRVILAQSITCGHLKVIQLYWLRINPTELHLLLCHMLYVLTMTEYFYSILLSVFFGLLQQLQELIFFLKCVANKCRTKKFTS